MPSNFTPNYQLNQWEAEDRVLRVDFNADNAKLDAAIKAVDGRADTLSAGKADRSALTAEADARKALAGQVAQKADQSALEALQARVDQIEDRRARKIKTGVPLAEDAPTYTIDFQGVDPGQWKTLYLVIDLTGPGTVQIGYDTDDRDANLRPGRSVLVLFPLFDPNARAFGIFLHGEAGKTAFCDGSRIANLSRILYISTIGGQSGVIRAGTTYEIWGEK